MSSSWAIAHAPAANAQATITRPAVVGQKHICTGIEVSIAAGLTAAGVVAAFLRDGASGAGTILWAGQLAAVINGTGWIGVTGLNIHGSPNTDMTLEFEGAGGATTKEAVSLQGKTVQSFL